MPSNATSVEIDLETYKAIEANRVNFDQSLGDILKGMIFGENERPNEQQTVPDIGHSAHKPRNYTKIRPLDYSFTYKGEHYSEHNLRDAYKAILLKLSASDPDFLENLSQEKTRARRLVARKPENLFFKSPELAINHAEKLSSGWWFDTNLSELQVVQRVKMACKVAGIRFDDDLVLDFT